MSALLQSMGKVLSLSSPPEASDVMTFRAQLCHVLRLTDYQGVYSLSRKRGHSTMRGHTWGTGSNQAAGVHRLWNGCFGVVVSGDVSALGTHWVWTVKPSFASALTASKREAWGQWGVQCQPQWRKKLEMLFGVCVGFGRGSVAVPQCLFVTLTSQSSHPYLSQTTASHWCGCLFGHQYHCSIIQRACCHCPWTRHTLTPITETTAPLPLPDRQQAECQPHCVSIKWKINNRKKVISSTVHSLPHTYLLDSK